VIRSEHSGSVTVCRPGGLLCAALLALAAGIAPQPAAAQEFDYIQAIVNPRLIIERNRSVNDAVNAEVGRRLAPGYQPAVTSGLAVLPTASYISPTADMEMPATASTSWSVYLDGSYTNIHDTKTVRAYDSDQYSISTGLDYQLSDRILVGALFNYSAADTDNKFMNGSSTVDSYSIAPYLGITLTENIVFDASFLYTWSDNNARSGVVRARYDGETWNLSANLTGYWYFGKLRVSPKVGVSYSRSHDDSYVDSVATFFPNEVTRTGTLNFGGTLGYTLDIGDNMSAEPYLSATGEWEFTDKPSPSVPGASPDTRDFDVRLETGVEFSLANNISLSLNGSIGGLARSRYRTLSGGGRLSFSF